MSLTEAPASYTLNRSVGQLHLGVSPSLLLLLLLLLLVTATTPQTRKAGTTAVSLRDILLLFPFPLVFVAVPVCHLHPRVESHGSYLTPVKSRMAGSPPDAVICTRKPVLCRPLQPQSCPAAWLDAQPDSTELLGCTRTTLAIAFCVSV